MSTGNGEFAERMAAIDALIEKAKATQPEASAAERMAALFAGLESAHGTYGEPEFDETGNKWGIKQTARTVQEPASVDLWTQHLDGARPLGIIPIDKSSTCGFAAIDVDEYCEDLTSLIDTVEQRRLPLVPCRSKSGGLHLFMFFSERVTAELAQRVMRDAATLLGLKGVEVFPKQTRLDKSDTGNWLAMPYFGGTFGGKLKEQVGIKRTGAAMTVKEFLAAAEQRRTTAEDLAAATKMKTTKKKTTKKKPSPEAGVPGNMPACLKAALESGVQTGQRNDTLFNAGVWARRKGGDWESLLAELNHAHFKPLLPHDEFTIVVKSLRKKDYAYRMGQGSMCPKGGCQGGCFKGGDVPVVLKVEMITTDPPTFNVHLTEGIVRDLKANQVMKFQQFVEQAWSQLFHPFPPMTQKEWTDLLNEAPREKIDPPADVTNEAVFLELLEDFLTNNQRGERDQDLLTGRPYLDVEAGRYWFRLQDLERFINRANALKDPNHGRKWKATRIRDLGGENEQLNIRIGTKVKRLLCWGVPDGTVTEVPEYEPPHIKLVI